MEVDDLAPLAKPWAGLFLGNLKRVLLVVVPVKGFF